MPPGAGSPMTTLPTGAGWLTGLIHRGYATASTDNRTPFPDGFRLGAGKQAIIHTGDGTSYTTSTSTHLYWGREWYVWNNNGDKVILRRADGSLKDTCSYSGAGSKKYC